MTGSIRSTLAPAPELRIAIVTETYSPEVNGVAMTTGRVLVGLMRRGHRIMLVRPRQHPAERPRSSRLLSEPLVSSIPLPRYAGLRVGLPATASLARLWTHERPHIAACICRHATWRRSAAHYAGGDLFLFPSLTQTFGRKWDARRIG